MAAQSCLPLVSAPIPLLAEWLLYSRAAQILLGPSGSVRCSEFLRRFGRLITLHEKRADVHSNFRFLFCFNQLGGRSNRSPRGALWCLLPCDPNPNPTYIDTHIASPLKIFRCLCLHCALQFEDSISITMSSSVPHR